MRKLIYLTLMVAVCLASCNSEKGRVNPFFEAWEAPYELPPFEKITVEDFKEAFEKAMEEHDAEIAAIVNNEEAATFENTVVALDVSGALLNKVMYVFSGIASAHGTPEINNLQSEMAPVLSKHNNAIMMNKELFKRIDFVKQNQLDQLTDNEDKTLLNDTWLSFVRGGANLEGDVAKRYAEISQRLSVLHNQFSQNMTKETANYQLVIDNDADLAGLSEGSISMAADRAAKAGMEGKWIFGLDNPSIMPFLFSAENRALRTELLDGYLNRCNNNNEFDNKALIAEMVALKKEQAQLLGYANFPEYVLERRMAKNAENVYDLLLKLWEPSLKVAKKERDEMQQLAGNEQITPADWRYYSDKVKAAKYNLSDDMLRPYLKADNVLEGIFYVCNRLWGITFKELKNVSRPHEDAQTFLCIDKDGQTELGILYIDLYARPGFKRGGAWCGSYRPEYYENGKRVMPITTIVCNFTPPLKDTPALLTPDETETYFHEFGHALHNLFRDVKYKGTGSVPRDFVELPSQIMEHWAFEPEVLAQYAKHYQTGEIIPQELVEKLDAASKYGQGFVMTEFLAAALLDMDYHMYETPEKLGKEVPVLDFEQKTLDKYGLISAIPPRYRSTYFQHVFAGGYTVGYYSYKWSEVLDCDAFAAFQETGDIFNQELAERFRKYVLAPGGIDPADQMYRNFRGKDPDIKALLEKRGLN